jgi:hypothetical protein
MPTSLIEECYRRAADARRLAETASMPSNKTNFLGMEQRWLVAAHSLTSERSFGGQPSVARIETPMAQQTMHVNEPKSQPAPRKGRRTKFTLERVQQIKNLVSQGKSREEIAGLIGVTVGSLQVTCSKLVSAYADFVVRQKAICRIKKFLVIEPGNSIQAPGRLSELGNLISFCSRVGGRKSQHRAKRQTI